MALRDDDDGSAGQAAETVRQLRALATPAGAVALA
ncbi:MAG: hypothetical protein JWR62_747, partial [Modestobacter sp.]|nr:hypothetical protein [Modestobacter sp.]